MLLPQCTLLAVLCSVSGFVSPHWRPRAVKPLAVSIGLGPEEKATEDQPKVAGVDYQVPNHEDFRLSRRSKLDEAADAWFASLLDGPVGNLGPLAEQAQERLLEKVELINDIELPKDHEDWTPYVSTKLPWTPLVPAYGLEQFGVPVPRRNAETWRHFDVAGMIGVDYSSETTVQHYSAEEISAMRDKLQLKGGWLDDDKCMARLVYVDGQYMEELSSPNDDCYNLASADGLDDEIKSYLSRLTDGFTDELVVGVQNGDQLLTSLQRLSGPNHNVGRPTSQFAINTQQGSACFAALNTLKTKSVAMVHAPKEEPVEDMESMQLPPPVLIVNAVTKSGSGGDGEGGVACHPRTLVVAEDHARLSVVQSMVDLDDVGDHRPKLYNGYTQFFIKSSANVTHSYLEESGGMVTRGVELSDEQVADMDIKPRQAEADRPELADTHLETIDVHVMGENGGYQGTVMCVGGSGRVRVALSATLLQPGATAKVNGFCLSGGTQRTDMKTNIHHVADGCTSRQVQKNMIGGRATGAFRGRIRVEQSAQQTDSQQLSRTVLLSDKARAWAVPSLEIIADDVQCAHGSTVSDLSEEELFYLRSRGLGRSMARNLLMYAFAGDISTSVNPAMLGSVDSKDGLQQRVIRRLENLVPQGERAVKGEFQSI